MRPPYSVLARRMGPGVVKPELEDLGTVEAADDESATRGGSPPERYEVEPILHQNGRS